MWIELMMQNAPGANTPGKQMAVLVFGVVMAGAGVVEIVRPDLLTKLLRRNGKQGDIRLFFAESMDRRRNSIMVGAAAILWGILFVALMINMLRQSGNLARAARGTSTLTHHARSGCINSQNGLKASLRG